MGLTPKLSSESATLVPSMPTSASSRSDESSCDTRIVRPIGCPSTEIDGGMEAEELWTSMDEGGGSLGPAREGGEGEVMVRSTG